MEDSVEYSIRSTRHRVGGVPFDAVTSRFAPKYVIAIARQQAAHVHLANAFSVALASSDERLGQVLSDDAAVNLPDGKPIGWVSWLRRDTPRLSQVRGPKFFLDVIDVGRALEQPVRHYLLGGSPKTLEQLQERLRANYPGVQIVGAASPPFRELTPAELAEQDSELMRVKPDIVWVGLGTPKQDYESQRISASTGLACVAVGAAFDFAAGSLRSAPEWMTRAGVEWLFRLVQEPRRLWRRYLFGNVRFVVSVVRNWSK